MYTALEISKYILNKCIEINRPISNLQLQKILYYVQGEYIKYTNGQVLFNDKIMAWDYGPSIPDVYYEYNHYSASNILDFQNNIELEQSIKDIIDPIIIEKSLFSAWILVEKTHSESPWIDAYNRRRNSSITINDLKKWFINN